MDKNQTIAAIMIIAGGAIALQLGSTLAATATGTASATIIRPSFTTNCQPLSFGNITMAAQAGNITISPAGKRQISGDISMGSAPHKASVCDVSGPANQAYIAKAPQTIYFSAMGSASISADGHSLKASDITIVSKNASHETGPRHEGISDANGADTLTIGATLHVPKGAAAGSYQGIIPITIHYN